MRSNKPGLILPPEEIQILKNLIQFDTTNPPGNERGCILYIKKLLEISGIEVELYAKDEDRPNLVGRIQGRGDAPPLLLYGHVDVVTTKGQRWTRPPFEGQMVDGFIWGRGALDMKGAIAMMIGALLRLKADEIVPAGDILFMALSDEENNGTYGALYMVEEHPEVFDGVRYALGEFGGFNIQVAGTRFYPIQVSEKQFCSVGVTVHGPGGHGATFVTDNAIGKTAQVLEKINHKHLPIHITTPLQTMVKEIANKVGFPASILFRMLLRPRLADILLRQMGDVGLTLMPMFRNTVNATIIRGGEKMNVIPSDVTMKLDGRILPGMSPQLLLTELREMIGFGEDDVEIELLYYDPGSEKVDMGLFNHLANVLQDIDPAGIPVPLLLPYVTDGRHLAKLGIQSYGFIPMKLPNDFDFLKLIHAEDERVPVDAIRFGTEGIYRAILNYSGKN